jgi:hypothetical protein
MSQEVEPFFTPKEWKSLVLLRPWEWRQWWSTEPLTTKLGLAMLLCLACSGAYEFLRGTRDLGGALLWLTGACLLLLLISLLILVLLAGIRWCLRKTGVTAAWRRVRQRVIAAVQFMLWASIAILIISLLGPYLSLSPVKSWYALTNDVPAHRVEIDNEPHDCDFMTAPLGDKNCHYEARHFVLQGADTPDGKKSLLVSYEKVKE